jgi:hypothetical protein
MNERIRELINEATSGPKWVPLYKIHEALLEKFAELIVRECMNQVREQYLPVLEDKEMMMFPHWDGYVQCGVDSYVAIRVLFGVEE